MCSTPEGQEWRHGDLPLIQSTEMTGKKFCAVGDLTSEKAGQDIWLRARVHTSRSELYLLLLLLLLLLLHDGMTAVFSVRSRDTRETKLHQ